MEFSQLLDMCIARMVKPTADVPYCCPEIHRTTSSKQPLHTTVQYLYKVIVPFSSRGKLASGDKCWVHSVGSDHLGRSRHDPLFLAIFNYASFQRQSKQIALPGWASYSTTIYGASMINQATSRRQCLKTSQMVPALDLSQWPVLSPTKFPRQLA